MKGDDADRVLSTWPVGIACTLVGALGGLLIGALLVLVGGIV